MLWRMKKDSAGFADELKHRIENGEPHPRKLAAVETTGPVTVSC